MNNWGHVQLSKRKYRKNNLCISEKRWHNTYAAKAILYFNEVMISKPSYLTNVSNLHYIILIQSEIQFGGVHSFLSGLHFLFFRFHNSKDRKKLPVLSDWLPLLLMFACDLVILCIHELLLNNIFLTFQGMFESLSPCMCGERWLSFDKWWTLDMWQASKFILLLTNLIFLNLYLLLSCPSVFLTFASLLNLTNQNWALKSIVYIERKRQSNLEFLLYWYFSKWSLENELSLLVFHVY